MNPVDWESFAIFALTSVTVVLIDYLRKVLDRTLKDDNKDDDDDQADIRDAEAHR